MSTFIDMKSVSQLAGYKFIIPNYQRGYRWEHQQIKELLEDLWEFTQNKSEHNTIYCLQPLVVTERGASHSDLLESIKSSANWNEVCRLVDENRNVWEVIDGQQRLTSVSIILQALRVDVPYIINYDTLEHNNDKVAKVSLIAEEDTKYDINLFYMREAYNYACRWLEKITKVNRDELRDTILKRVKFIWYQSDEDKAISIFTRLNVGSIALTGSELIKALFLNRSNFKDEVDQQRNASQVEIAKKWDEIESQLQDDEFWLFLNDSDNRTHLPTRIDFLLNFLVTQKDYLKFDENEVGTDKYRTFRCYYKEYNRNKTAFVERWNDIQDLFDTLYEWYCDSELYHYVGYLLTIRTSSLQEIYKEWLLKDKRSFVAWLRKKAAYSINKCKDLETDYYYKGEKDTKRQAIPLLLLHNVITVIRQNEVLSQNSKYHMGVFYKFPFHLYKIEQWDVEHIDSATPNNLTDSDEQLNWILSAYQCLSKKDQEAFKDDIRNYCQHKDDDSEDAKSVTYEALALRLQQRLGIHVEDSDEGWKNKIKNFTLLDSSTNRSYKNTIFPNKRNHIIGKEKGRLKVITWDKNRKELVENDICFDSAFVPPCTKNVFQKTYSSLQGDITRWTEDDANAYRAELQETINYVTEQ